MLSSCGSRRFTGGGLNDGGRRWIANGVGHGSRSNRLLASGGIVGGVQRRNWRRSVNPGVGDGTGHRHWRGLEATVAADGGPMAHWPGGEVLGHGCGGLQGVFASFLRRGFVRRSGPSGLMGWSANARSCPRRDGRRFGVPHTSGLRPPSRQIGRAHV